MSNIGFPQNIRAEQRGLKAGNKRLEVTLSQTRLVTVKHRSDSSFNALPSTKLYTLAFLQCCSALQGSDVHNTTLHYTKLQYTTLHYTTLHYTKLH